MDAMKLQTLLLIHDAIYLTEIVLPDIVTLNFIVPTKLYWSQITMLFNCN